MGCYWWRYYLVFIGGSGSLNCFVLGDCVLRLGRRWSARLFCTGGYLRGEDVLFEEVLADKFFQVPSEAIAVDCPVSFIVVIRATLFCSREYKVVLDWPWAPHL